MYVFVYCITFSHRQSDVPVLRRQIGRVGLFFSFFPRRKTFLSTDRPWQAFGVTLWAVFR